MRCNHICPICNARMELRRVYQRSIGMGFYLRCSNPLCSCAGPLALSEMSAAAKWLDLVSGHSEPPTVYEEKTVSLSRPTAPTDVTRKDLPLLPGERASVGATLLLRPLDALTNKVDLI